MQKIRKQILPLTAFYMNECSWQESNKSITALEKTFLKASINLNREQVHGITLLIVNVWFPLKENKNCSDSNSICCDYKKQTNNKKNKVWLKSLCRITKLLAPWSRRMKNTRKRDATILGIWLVLPAWGSEWSEQRVPSTPFIIYVYRLSILGCSGASGERWGTAWAGQPVYGRANAKK